MNNHFKIISIWITMTMLHILPITFCQDTFYKTYGDTTAGHMEQGRSVLQTNDGGYIIAGEYNRYYVGSPNYYYGDVYLIRTDQYGDTIWTKTYGEPNMWEAAYSMDRTDDGGCIIAASKFDSQLWHLWLIKINSQGDSVWSKIYPVQKGAQKGYCIKKTNDGGYLVTGGYSDISLLRINAQGDMLWFKTYDNKSEWEEGTYVQQTSDGGYIITGFTEFPEPRSLDIWLIKTDSQGDTLWTKTYGSDYIDLPNSLCETKDGGYLIAGQYTEHGELGLEAHIWLLMTDSKGDTLWTKKINNGSWGDYAYSMKNTSDGGFIIAGETDYENFDSDIYLLKLDEEGNNQWTGRIGRNLGEIGDEKHYRGNDVAETSDGGYIITGFKCIYIGWDQYEDLCLLKVDYKGQITGVSEKKTNIPSNFALQQNYPNPFNSETIIPFSVALSCNVRIEVFDMLGRRVETIMDSCVSPGEYAVRFSSHTLSTGIYFYRIHAGELNSTRKLVIIR